jgi:hypothetical protein
MKTENMKSEVSISFSSTVDQFIARH